MEVPLVPAPSPAVTTPLERLPEAVLDESSTLHMDGTADIPNWTAAKVLVEHLFARDNASIPGVDYAVGYQLAHGLTGGDIVDVYRFDNDAVAFSIADISGKGTDAAVHAALVKYGLRAYASQGLTPERVLRSLDRLYLENSAFERTESFASVFFASIDSTRRMMHYASGGHEAAVILIPGERPQVIEPTAPLIGVFDDQHHLFKQGFVELPPGTIFVATTDGVTEARSPAREFFGMDRFVELIRQRAEAPTQTIVRDVIAAAREFTEGHLHDDVAVLAARFP